MKRNQNTEQLERTFILQILKDWVWRAPSGTCLGRPQVSIHSSAKHENKPFLVISQEVVCSSKIPHLSELIATPGRICNCSRVSRRNRVHRCLEIPEHVHTEAHFLYPGPAFSSTILESNNIVAYILLQRTASAEVAANRIFVILWNPLRAGAPSQTEVARASPGFLRVFRQYFPGSEHRSTCGRIGDTSYTLYCVVS